MRAVAADAESGRPVQLFGAVRGRIILIALLGLVSAICSIVPFIVIVELSRLLWTMQSGVPIECAVSGGTPRNDANPVVNRSVPQAIWMDGI